MATVVEWERLLTEKIAYVELLGELNLSAEETGDLGQAIAQLVRRNEPMVALGLLRRQYPASVSVYLVFKGIYNYVGGDYWSAVAEETGLISTNAHTRMGQCFEWFLQQNGLPLFQGLNGLHYVAPLLLHGGIPDYSLPDFFVYFFQRIVAHATSTNQNDVRDVINEWLHTSASSVPADKSIPRFLTYGGRFVLDFVARCLELHEYYETRHTLPAPEMIGLPERVLTAYKNWSSQWRQVTTNRLSHVRLVRPMLLLDPWGDGPTIDFPAQLLSHNQRIEDGRWAIRCSHPGPERHIETLPLYPQWRESGWETEPYQFEVPFPGNYSVSLEVDDGKGMQVLRSWYFSCDLSEQTPSLLAFDGESGEFLTQHNTLPAKRLWLLISRQQRLLIDRGVKYEKVGCLVGAWADYIVEAWDLHSATSVILGSRTIPVEPDMRQFQPYLQGQLVSEIEVQPDHPLLFTGSFPELFIPLPSQRDSAIEAERWRVAVSTLYEGGRVQILTASLAEIDYCLDTNEPVSRLKLALSELDVLREVCLGHFEIALKGPLGRDITFHFAVVPGLQIQIQDLDRLRIPFNGKVPSLSFVLTIIGHIHVESSSPAVSVQPGPAQKYCIHVSGECSRADLKLCFSEGSFQSVVPFSVPCPILTWALVEGDNPTLCDDHWQTRLLNRPQMWLEQAKVVRLLVGMAIGNQHRALDRTSLLVHYSQREPPHELISRGQNKPWLTFHLREAEDSVRTCRDGLIRFDLLLAALPGQTTPCHLPVLQLDQTLGLTSLALEGVLVDQSWLFSLSWKETVLFRNRYVLFWSLWRPWEEPLRVSIPDRCVDRYDFDVSLAHLTPGKYRAGMVLIDPWSGNVPARPLTSMVNSIDLLLGNTQERIIYLRHTMRDLPGILEHILSAEHVSYRQHMTQQLNSSMVHGFIRHIFVALLTLLENTHTPVEDKTIDTLVALLQQRPLDLLATIARESQPLPEQARGPFEDLFWRILPAYEPLLRQIYQDASIEFDDLLTLMPELLHQNDVRAEAFSLLLEAGVRVKEGQKGALPDVLDGLDADLPDWLFSDHQLDSVRLYLREIGQYHLLNMHQEQRLASYIREGHFAKDELLQLSDNGSLTRTMLLEHRIKTGSEARQRLANANLRLVVNAAKSYIGRGMDFLDLVQNGNIGLLTAIDKFDGARGYRFSTYATWWIRQSISRKLADETRLIRIPVHVVEELGRLKRATQKLRFTLDREPTQEELAEELQQPLMKIKQLALLQEQPKSLDQPVGDEDGTSLGDLLVQEGSDPSDQVVAQSVSGQIEHVLATLKPQQRSVLELRFGLLDGEKKTLEEIGKMMDVTRERVRQIEEKALKRLRTPDVLATLKDYIWSS